MLNVAATRMADFIAAVFWEQEIDVEPYDTYKYGEGKYAYFVRDEDYETLQIVYFAERGVMYQLFIDKSEEGTEIAKKIVEHMAE